MNISDLEKKRIDDLQQSITESWLGNHIPIPNILYHYTSADGLIGILTSKSMWITELRYMNDLSELQYSREIIEKRLGVKQNAPGLNEIQKEFIKRIISSFDPFSHGNSAFSASFCEAGNLLSQWRAYRGRGGGYAIGFDFFHTIRLLNRRCVLRKVIYDDFVQTHTVDSTIDAFLTALHSETQDESLEDVTSTFLPALCQAFSSIIAEYLFSFKHPDFHEEREWRLVHFSNISPTYNRNGDLPSFRSFDGNVIPYLSVSFEMAIRASRDDTSGIPFPIVELNIGPTVNAELNQQSISTLLLALHPDFAPNIIKSEIPLRWL